MRSETPEETRAHYEGPVASAVKWLHAVLRHTDYNTAWRLSDDEYRLGRAQAWLWNNRGFPAIAGSDLNELAAALSAVPSLHPLWRVFARIEVDHIQRAWAGWNPDRLGAGSRPRIVDVDYEVVVFTHTDDWTRDMEPSEVPALLFLMHYVNRSWLVAQAGTDRRIIPGWPPVFS